MIEFSHQQRRALHALLARQPNLDGSPSVKTFLFGYMFVEALLQTIGRYYRERKGSGSLGVGGHEKLQLDVVQRSLKHFGVPVPHESSARLLDSKAIRFGFKSARNLRNGIVHEWNKGAFEEAVIRFKELNSLNLLFVKTVEKRVLECGR
jgi:hypothetical protein